MTTSPRHRPANDWANPAPAPAHWVHPTPCTRTCTPFHHTYDICHCSLRSGPRKKKGRHSATSNEAHAGVVLNGEERQANTSTAMPNHSMTVPISLGPNQYSLLTPCLTRLCTLGFSETCTQAVHSVCCVCQVVLQHTALSRRLHQHPTCKLQPQHNHPVHLRPGNTAPTIKALPLHPPVRKLRHARRISCALRVRTR